MNNISFSRATKKKASIRLQCVESTFYKGESIFVQSQASYPTAGNLLERVGEKKRANEDCERKPKRQRRRGVDVTEFSREKSENDSKICKEELHLKARETEKGKEKQAQMVNSQKPNLIPGFLFSAS